MQHRLQRFVAWRQHFDEFRLAVCAAPIHTVQHQAVKVNIEIGRGPKALNQRDRAAVGLVRLQARLIEKENEVSEKTNLYSS